VVINRRKKAVATVPAEAVGPSPKELEWLRQNQEYDDLTRLLACQTMPFEVDIDAIPAERRTIHLRFLDLKRRVCRPYAVK
jgi:hypothetical protein